MAVVECKLKAGSRRGPVRRKDGRYTYHEIWIVRTDSANDDGLVVEKAPGLPAIGQSYLEDAAAGVTGRNPRQTKESDLVWEVDVTYTEQRMGLIGTKITTLADLSAALPLRDWSSVSYRVYRTEDRKGKKYLNSVGDPFDPPPPEFRINRLLTIQHVYLTHDEALAEKYLNSINTDAIRVDNKVFPPFSARFNRWDAQSQYLSDGTPYHNYTVEIEFMTDGDLWFPWKERDRGPRHKVVGKEGVFLPKDNDGVTYQGMVLLDGLGFPAKKSETLTVTAHIDFDIYEKLPFTTSRIPFLLGAPDN